MDTFLEYLLAKKSTGLDWLKKIGVLIAALLVSLIAMVVLNIPQIRALVGTFTLLVVVGAFYGAYILIRDMNLEYEYIFTNGDLDIDKIKGRKTRKRMVSLSCENIECMAKLDDPNHAAEFKNESIGEKIDAVYNESAGDVYGVIFRRQEKVTLLKFQPPERLVEAMKKFNPRCIHDGKPGY